VTEWQKTRNPVRVKMLDYYAENIITKTASRLERQYEKRKRTHRIHGKDFLYH